MKSDILPDANYEVRYVTSRQFEDGYTVFEGDTAILFSDEYVSETR